MRFFINTLAFLGFVAILIGVVLIFTDYSVKLNLSQVCENGNCNGEDTISIAAKLGRLDLISFSLTFLGLAIGIMVVYSVISVKAEAISAAREETKIIVDTKIKEEFGFLMPQLVNTEIKKYFSQKKAPISLNDVDLDDILEELDGDSGNEQNI